jgi:hypothetical protein
MVWPNIPPICVPATLTDRLDIATAMEPGSKDDPLSFPYTKIQHFNNVNLISPYVAAQEAIKGFAQLPEDASKTFIFTGNKLNVKAFPGLISMGLGKSASATLMQNLAAAYEKPGYR